MFSVFITDLEVFFVVIKSHPKFSDRLPFIHETFDKCRKKWTVLFSDIQHIKNVYLQEKILADIDLSLLLCLVKHVRIVQDKTEKSVFE